MIIMTMRTRGTSNVLGIILRALPVPTPPILPSQIKDLPLDVWLQSYLYLGVHTTPR